MKVSPYTDIGTFRDCGNMAAFTENLKLTRIGKKNAKTQKKYHFGQYFLFYMQKIHCFAKGE